MSNEALGIAWKRTGSNFALIVKILVKVNNEKAVKKQQML